MQKNRNFGIILEIRKQILSGKLLPGQRMPTRAFLEKKYKVSKVTMQKAIDALVADGTVETRGRHGTYVSKYPTELYHYGLIFQYKQSHDFPWSRQWDAIKAEAEKVFQKSPYRLSIFYGDQHYLNANGNVDFMDDLNNCRMAGLIFIMDPKIFEGTGLIEQKDIPKVTLYPQPGCLYPSVNHNSGDIYRQMVLYMAKEKRTKVSLIMSSRQYQIPGFIDSILTELDNCKLEIHDCWIQGADLLFPKSVKNITQLIMYDPKFRPDGIIILDDNLISGVIDGLTTCNLQNPEEVKLAAVTNFPYCEKLKLPVKMFGFDITRQIKVAKAKLEAIAKGLPYEQKTSLKYISDNDYQKNNKGE
jgi:DNA-binding LacI/PurR family transcriptional regulator